MFSGDTGNVLMPFLLNIVNGTDNQILLNPTTLLSASSLGALNPFESTTPTKEQRVGVIQVHHPIFKYDQNCGPKGTQTIMSILDTWKEDDTIIGVVMDYNSGGGQAAGTRQASRYIFDYPKPIVSYTNDLVGSAALYMYAASKYRFVNQYAEFIGCIGSMMQKVDLTGVIEKAGGKVIEMYSDLSPEKNLQARELKKGNERPVIEKLLNPDAAKFQKDMKEFLPNITEKALLGDIFTPEEAIEEGLADSFGTLQDAINKVFELSKENKQNNPKSNTNMNTKSLPKVEAVLGLAASLALTENGSYLNEEQLDTIEASLDSLESENSNLQTQLTDAQNANTTSVETVQGQLTEATNNLTAVETSVDAILESAGLPVTGSLTEKLAAVNGKAEVFGKSDGASHSNPKVGANEDVEATNNVGGIDVSAAMNN